MTLWFFIAGYSRPGAECIVGESLIIYYGGNIDSGSVVVVVVVSLGSREALTDRMK